MARIKRHLNARNHQGIKRRRRKSDIPELVYKFLVASGAVRGAAERSGFASTRKCRCCDGEVPHAFDEVAESADSPPTAGGAMGPRRGRGSHTGRVAKPTQRGVKGRPADLPISYLQDCVGSEGTRRARRYIMKALDFGIEAGYLVPSDSAYKVLRVSSDLMKSDTRRRRYNTCDKALSQERDKSPHDTTPSRLEDLQVQEQRRRRRRRRGRGRRGRSRSDSRRKGRGRRRRRRSRRRRRRRRRIGSRSRSEGRTRYGSPQNPEEIVEDDEANDYEMDKSDPKGDIRADDAEREPKTARSKQSTDEEQSTKKAEENGSDLSVDEEETDDEEERKTADTTKS